MKSRLSTQASDTGSDRPDPAECYDLVVIGAGISCAYTLIHYLALLEQQPPEKPRQVLVLEKSGEFWPGIPYGRRSGGHALLISSLKEFLPQNGERDAFAAWLSQNRTWVFDQFKQGDGALATRWLRQHAQAMADGLWDDLFLPRYTFGQYLQQRLAGLLRSAAAKGLLECRLLAAEAVDVQALPDVHRIDYVTADGAGGAVLTGKVILGIGSPPNGGVEQPKAGGKGCFVSDMYEPSLEFNLRRIGAALQRPHGRGAQVLIVGSNAGALDALFCLNNSRELSGLISKFVILSSDAEFPHRISSGEVTPPSYCPRHLGALVQAGALTAGQILEAVRLDVACAKMQHLNIADLFGDISTRMIETLNQLSVAEQQKFVAQCGVEIGRLQRRAGAEYLDVVDALTTQGKLDRLKGRCVRCVELGDGELGCEVVTGVDRQDQVIAGAFGVVINCAGFQDVTDSSAPLIRNLIRRQICVPNASKRGFLIDESYAASADFYVMGPLVAGNLAGPIRVWHAESCSRIIGMARQLAEVLMRDARAAVAPALGVSRHPRLGIQAKVP